MTSTYKPRRPSVTLICEQCGTLFLKHASAVAAGRGRYCRRACQDAAPPSPPLPAILSEDGLTARVPLIGRGGVIRAHATIDAADAAWASQWTWGMTAGYASRTNGKLGKDKRTVLLHRELLGLTRGDGVFGDHINQDKLDDRRANLRPTTRRESAQNVPSHANTSSTYRGVTWDKSRGKWLVIITVDGKHYHIGRFTNENEAAEAAREARLRLMPFSTD